MLASIHKSIKNEYSTLTQQAKTLQDKRRLELFQNVEGYKELDELLMKYRKELIKNIANPNETDNSFLAGRITSTIAKKHRLLEQNNYPINYIEDVYECNICKDTGLKEAGKHCTCYNHKLSKKLQEFSKLGTKLSEENFSTFVLDYYSTSKDPNSGMVPQFVAKTAYDKLFKFSYNLINDIEQKDNNFYIYGNAGVGKSFLCHSVLNVVTNSAKSYVYLPSQEFFNILQSYKFSNNSHDLGNDAYINFLSTCDLLVIDDLGTEYKNAVTEAEFFHIIDYRLRSKKSTIISSNLSLSELKDHYTQRMVSRIIGEFMTLNIIGSDIRINKKYKGI